MTNTPMTKEEPKMLGNVSTDELVEMGKTHPRSALTIAYSEGVIVGINKAKAQQAQTIAELVEALKSINKLAKMVADYNIETIATKAIAKVKGK